MTVIKYECVICHPGGKISQGIKPSAMGEGLSLEVSSTDSDAKLPEFKPQPYCLLAV